MSDYPDGSTCTSGDEFSVSGDLSCINNDGISGDPADCTLGATCMEERNEWTGRRLTPMESVDSIFMRQAKEDIERREEARREEERCEENRRREEEDRRREEEAHRW